MASNKAGSAASPNSNKSSLWTTLAMAIPMLFLGIDKWPQVSSRLNLEHWTLAQASPSAVNTATNITQRDSITWQKDMKQQYTRACPDHRYNTRIMSGDPLIIYIENLVSQSEAAYLSTLAEPYYAPSPLGGRNGRSYNNDYRSSVSATLPNDPVAECIAQRIADFQGYYPIDHVEPIQVVKYGPSHQFRPHFDWDKSMLNKRLSTFFVYLQCDDPINGGECEGGETGFPNWTGPFSPTWCRQGFVDCTKASEGGIYFRPVIGNAVFWPNFYPNGTGVQGSWHAGMPVTKGRKVGLNMFVREDKFTGEKLAVWDRDQLSNEDRARCDAVSKDGPCIVEVS